MDVESKKMRACAYVISVRISHLCHGSLATAFPINFVL